MQLRRRRPLRCSRSTPSRPGEQFTIVQDGAVGLFALQIGGLICNLLSMVTGGTRTLTFSCPATATTLAACGWAGN